MSWGRLSATLATKFGVRHQRASERASERKRERARASESVLSLKGESDKKKNVALVERLGTRLQG